MLLSTKDTNTEFFLQVSVQFNKISVLYKKQSLPFAISTVAVCVNVIHYIIDLYLSLVCLGCGSLSGCHAGGLPCQREPPAHHQALLHTNVSPVRGRDTHRTKLLNASLLTSHAQPLHHPSTCLPSRIDTIT